jgi:hypothetical protein
MAECSYSSCIQEKRAIKRELQKWTKDLVYLVGECAHFFLAKFKFLGNLFVDFFSREFFCGWTLLDFGVPGLFRLWHTLALAVV